MSGTSRPLLVGALAAAAIALISCATVAVGAVGGLPLAGRGRVVASP